MIRIACILAVWGGAGATPLPDVDAVLTKASSKAQDFAEQARAIQQRLLEQQTKSRGALAAQKTGYEKQLNALKAQSEAIRTNNSALQAGNLELERNNAKTLEETKQLQAENKKLRSALQGISEKVSVTKSFVVDSLKVTDDIGSQELEVLAPPTPRPTLDHFLEVSNSDSLSLLAVSAAYVEAQAPDPRQDVAGLSASLAEIASAEAEGAAELKATFQARFEEAQASQASLNATQETLLKTQAELLARRRELLDALSHLQNTHSQLTSRLLALGIFADAVHGLTRAGLKHDEPANMSNVSSATSAAANASHASVANSSAMPNASRSLFLRRGDGAGHFFR